MGGCGCTRCPANRILSHVAQDMARAWFRGVGAYCADFGAFWRLFGLFPGHMVELKGTRGLSDMMESSRTCSVATIPPRLGVSPGVGGYFGLKKAVFGQKLRRFGRAPPNLAPRPRAATGESVDLARPPPRLQDGESRSQAQGVGKVQWPKRNGDVLACLLLAC